MAVDDVITCLRQVLFPLLHLLLENIDAGDPHGIEETRMRASTLLCKVGICACVRDVLKQFLYTQDWYVGV